MAFANPHDEATTTEVTEALIPVKGRRTCSGLKSGDPLPTTRKSLDCPRQTLSAASSTKLPSRKSFDAVRDNSSNISSSSNTSGRKSLDGLRNHTLSKSSPDKLLSLSKLIKHGGFLDEDKYNQYIATNQKASRLAAWSDIKVPVDPIKAMLKLKFIIRKGIPDHLRARIWLTITGTEHYLKQKNQSKEALYKERLHEVFGEKVPKKILKPALFGGELRIEDGCLTPQSEIAAKRILCVVAHDFPSIRFSPLVPDVVMLLLHFLCEEDTYIATYLMMLESQKTHKYFHLDATDYDLFRLTFRSLVKRCLPKLHNHMTKIEVDFKSLCDRWFKRLYLGELPIRAVFRIFDVFLNEGGRILYRIGLGILTTIENSLLRTVDNNSFFEVLQQQVAQLADDDLLLKTSCKISLSRLEKYRNRNCTRAAPDPSHIPHHVYYRPKPSHTSNLITEEMFEEIYTWIPMRFRITDPVLLFASYRDGYSFKTMYRKIENQEPILLVVKSDIGWVFGAYISVKWQLTTMLGNMGTQECFLFRLLPNAKKFPWEEGNPEVFLNVQPNSFWIGASNGVGLCVDDEWEGCSNKCATFNNEPLNGDRSDKFSVTSVEVWGFE